MSHPTSSFRRMRAPMLAIAMMGIVAASCGGRGRSAASTSAPSAAPAAATAAPDSRAVAAGPLTPASASDLLQRMRGGAKATLVNVWATWCGPCREELPELLRLAREQREHGLRVMLVSADLDSAEVRPFLSKQGVEFETYFRTGDDMSFINDMNPSWTGSLPATFLYDSTGTLVQFWEGRADYEKFQHAALAAMGGAVPHHSKSL